MKYLLLVLTLIGCGTQEQTVHRDMVVALNGMSHYVSLFQEQAHLQGQDITITDLIIQMGDIKQDPTSGSYVLANCLIAPGKSPLITVDKTSWLELELIQRQLLIFHEMGHCVLHREHVTDGALSIMNPDILYPKVFIDNEKKLMSELFDKAKANSWNLTEVSKLWE